MIKLDWLRNLSLQAPEHRAHTRGLWAVLLGGVRYVFATDGCAITLVRSDNPANEAYASVVEVVTRAYTRAASDAGTVPWSRFARWLPSVRRFNCRICKGTKVVAGNKCFECDGIGSRRPSALAGKVGGTVVDKRLVAEFVGPLSSETIRWSSGGPTDPVHFWDGDELWRVIVMPLNWAGMRAVASKDCLKPAKLVLGARADNV